MTSQIQIILKNIQTGDTYELPFSTFSFTEELDKSRNSSVTVDYLGLKAIADTYKVDLLTLLVGGQREIWINKINGTTITKIYYGIISDVQLTKNNFGVLEFTIGSVGHFALFAKRRTAAKRVFSATDAAQIAWTLISESQSNGTYANLGITSGSLPTTVNRDETYRFGNIKDEIVNLCALNIDKGFDFDIDFNKQFQVYYPFRGSLRPDIIFDVQNIHNWTYRKSLMMALTNSVYVIGDGFNDDTTYAQVQANNDYLAAFGLLEDVITNRTQTSSNNLTDTGKKHLSYNQAPLPVLQISHIDDFPDLTSYNLGDFVLVSLPESGINNEYHRVMKRSFNIDQQLLPVVTLDLL